MPKGKRIGRVSKDQWLEVALEELEKGGIPSVRVERLARILSVNKSGFYFHFKNLDDLKKRLLDYWVHEYTEIVTMNPIFHKGEPKTRLALVTKTIQEYDLGKYDLAIRAWAKLDKSAQEAVELVTNIRLNFISEIFSDLGFKGDDLKVRTKLYVSYHTWESATFANVSPRLQSRQRKRILDLLTSH